MDDSALVRRLERIGDMPRDGERLVDRDWSLRDAIGKRRAFDEFQTSNGPPSLASRP